MNKDIKTKKINSDCELVHNNAYKNIGIIPV